jgi:hypothetical protein
VAPKRSNPIFAPNDDVPILLPGLLRLVLLQIRKIATILRQAGALKRLTNRNPWIAEALSRRLNHVAIGPSRHHAILQLAGGGQIAREPDADRKQDNDNDKAGDGAIAAFGLVVLRRITPGIIFGIVRGLGHFARVSGGNSARFYHNPLAKRYA